MQVCSKLGGTSLLSVLVYTVTVWWNRLSSSTGLWQSSRSVFSIVLGHQNLFMHDMVFSCAFSVGCYRDCSSNRIFLSWHTYVGSGI